MPKSRLTQKISTDHAPAAVGLYSQAVSAGDFVFVSGQFPIDPATNQLIDTLFLSLRRISEEAKALP